MKQTRYILLVSLMLVGAGCSPSTTTVDTNGNVVSGLSYGNNTPVLDPNASPPPIEPTPAPVDVTTTVSSSAPLALTLDQKLTFKQAAMEIDQNKQYTAVLHTNVGDITVALNAKATPITVNNFVTLAEKHFYDNTIFHRVIKGFMIQGGDPRGDGTGGPGYKFADEPFTGEYTRGTIAMANAGPNTNGSQFFIMHEGNALPKNYVIFGHVTAGLDVVDKIATAPVGVSAMGEPSKPVTPVTVTGVDIEKK